MKPFLYKISGVWGNHEGSILLWALMLAFYAALIPVFGRHLPQSLKARAIAVQGLLAFGFLAFILFTSVLTPSSKIPASRYIHLCFIWAMSDFP